MSVMADKAVSTEDLCVKETPEERALGVVRLEAILHTLFENKVESLKNESRRAQSLQSSPRKILNRLRLVSSPAITTKYSEQKNKNDGAQNKRKSRSSADGQEIRHSLHRLRQDGSYRPQSWECSCEEAEEEEEDPKAEGGVMPYGTVCTDGPCPSCIIPPDCCCAADLNVRMHFDDDYISLKIEETDEIISEEALRRAKRKRRRRRKRRMKRAIAMGTYDPEAATHIHDRRYKKVLDDEDLPQPARWTIVATACILLFMCLLLIGITLRMAPIIDDMVRKENEELMNSLSKGYNLTAVRSLS